MDPAQVFEAQEIARHSSILNKAISGFDSPVQRFYEDGVVFITGASGFLGKQIVEKLLRSCKMKKIYILFRSKKKKSFDERIQDLVQDPVYECLRKSQPNFWQKIIPVEGDISKINLGLSEEDRILIVEEVKVIIHCAATINFTEPLKMATLTNVRGTREMLTLAKECKRLKSFVYVSTAYSHARLSHANMEVLEKFYQSPISPEALIELVESLPEDRIIGMTAQLTEDWPNTYVFTKAVAEELIRTMSGNLPTCIVRPTIVISTIREPMPGWIDPSCVNSFAGLVIAGAVGVMHLLNCKNDNMLDLVPVDLVNNAVIAAAYESAQRCERGERDIKIYTVTSSKIINTIGNLTNILDDKVMTYATDKAINVALMPTVENTFLYLLLSWLFENIPGYIVDGVLKLLGKKPILTKVYDKLNKLFGVLELYGKYQFYFRDTNLRELYGKLSPTDRLIFDCIADSIDWEHYTTLYLISIRKYIIRDGINQTRVGIRKQIFFRIMVIILVPLYLFSLYKLFYLFGYVLYSYLFNKLF